MVTTTRHFVCLETSPLVAAEVRRTKVYAWLLTPLLLLLPLLTSPFWGTMAVGMGFEPTQGQGVGGLVSLVWFLLGYALASDSAERNLDRIRLESSRQQLRPRRQRTPRQGPTTR